MFIYLNRTGFNGLFRVNSRGAYNVPPGRYQRPRIVDRDKLARAAGALAAPGVELRCGSFESTLEFARAGDFLYLDPLYAPLNATSRFTAYTAGGFDVDDQKRLQQAVIALARRGCHIVVSNSTAAEITALTGGTRTRAGLACARWKCWRAAPSTATPPRAVPSSNI